MAITKSTPTIKNSVQNNIGSSFDEDFGVLATEGLGYDGVNLQRLGADNMAVKITVSGTDKYVGLAKPGTAQATAKWQVMKIDTASGTVITWADGDSDFDNVATDLPVLSYS